jgi:predicted metallo-beta-lactamase superfamily hydrolase
MILVKYFCTCGEELLYMDSKIRDHKCYCGKTLTEKHIDELFNTSEAFDKLVEYAKQIKHLEENVKLLEEQVRRLNRTTI